MVYNSSTSAFLGTKEVIYKQKMFLVGSNESLDTISFVLFDGNLPLL